MMIEAKSMGNLGKAARGVVLGAAKVGLALAVGGTGLAQRAATVRKAPVKAATVAARPVAGESAAKQGIKVSGYWKIDIKNPDGTLASHREFENSLYDNELLPALLLGTASIGNPVLEMKGDRDVPTPCGSGKVACVILKANDPSTCPTNNCSRNLSITPRVSYSPIDPNSSMADGFTLAGFFQAAQDGTLTSVFTAFRMCTNTSIYFNTNLLASSTSPAACATGAAVAPDTYQASPLTRFVLTNPGNGGALIVKAGQIVQVSVLLSFS